MQPAVYILSSRPYGPLYTGVTSNLTKRVWPHRNGRGGRFSQLYGTKRLAYYEFHADMYAAIFREKCIKKWRRSWKVELIEKDKPGWADLLGK